MITVIRTNYRSYKQVKGFLKDFNPIHSKFYSEYKGICLFYILKRQCYSIIQGKTIRGLIFLNPSSSSLYYIPSSNKPLSLFAVIFLIKKYINPTGYSLKLKHSALSFSAISSYLNKRPSYNLKYMICRLDFPTSEKCTDNSVSIKPLKKDEDALRVKLQNSIFGDIKGRIPITTEEVRRERSLSGYIPSMCYILRVNEVACGYGQITSSNGIYSLINFGIVPNMRGMGYGDILLRHILEDCRLNKISVLHLTVDNNNPKAICLYAKNGFQELYNIVEFKL